MNHTPFKNENRRPLTAPLKLLAGLLLLLALAPSRADEDQAPPTAPESELQEEALPDAAPVAETGEPANGPVDAAPVADAKEPTPAPVEAAPATIAEASTTGKTTRHSRRDYSVPFYEQKRPNWAVELSAATRTALGNATSFGVSESPTLQGFSVQGEYQPEILQFLGVLGAGASATVYTTSPINQLTSNLAGLLSYGAQVRYQARFLRNQWVVPVAGYSMEWLRYSLKSGLKGTASTSGPFFGGMLLLSAFDADTAAELYATTDISRVYLLAELRNRSGSDENLSLSGSSYFFGLRFEF